MRRVRVSDKMQKGYSYTLSESPGRNFHPDFKPELSPAQMLALGVFGGKYLDGITTEMVENFKSARKREVRK